MDFVGVEWCSGTTPWSVVASALAPSPGCGLFDHSSDTEWTEWTGLQLRSSCLATRPGGITWLTMQVFYILVVKGISYHVGGLEQKTAALISFRVMPLESSLVLYTESASAAYLPET